MIWVLLFAEALVFGLVSSPAQFSYSKVINYKANFYPSSFSVVDFCFCFSIIFQFLDASDDKQTGTSDLN